MFSGEVEGVCVMRVVSREGIRNLYGPKGGGSGYLLTSAGIGVVLVGVTWVGSKKGFLGVVGSLSSVHSKESGVFVFVDALFSPVENG